MTKEQTKVQAWMLAIGQIAKRKPVIPTLKVAHLRHALIAEENDELKEAFIKDDIVAVADALGDLLVVVYGAAVACGIDLEPVFDEIMRSNDSKIKDGYKREDGKWMKGPSYTPPNLKPIIEEQLTKE